MRTLGLSPKIIGPVAAALAAFLQAKIHDEATALLVIALVGAIAAFFAPPGHVTSDTEAGVDDGDDDPLTADLPDDLLVAADGDPEGIVRPEAGQVPAPPEDA